MLLFRYTYRYRTNNINTGTHTSIYLSFSPEVRSATVGTLPKEVIRCALTRLFSFGRGQDPRSLDWLHLATVLDCPATVLYLL